MLLSWLLQATHLANEHTTRCAHTHNLAPIHSFSKPTHMAAGVNRFRSWCPRTVCCSARRGEAVCMPMRLAAVCTRSFGREECCHRAGIAAILAVRARATLLHIDAAQ